MSAKVSTRTPVSVQKRSQRTAVEKDPSQAPPSTSADAEKPIGEKCQDQITQIISTIQSIWISIKNFFYNLYLVLKFIWEKPDVAWDLVSTTFHLIKVSRDAGLWSWSQLWEMFYRQTFAPMIRAEKEKEEAAQKAQ